MLSSNHSINSICKLFIDLKEYVELKGEYMQVDLACKLSKLITVLVFGAIVFMLATISLIFLSLMIAAAISPYVGGDVISFGIITGAYVVLAALIYYNKKAWIETPVTNFLNNLFFEPKNAPKKEEKPATK